MKVPTFEEAIQSKDIFDYEVHRNVLGWQLSYTGGDLSVCITKEEAFKIMGLMDRKDFNFAALVLSEEENKKL